MAFSKEAFAQEWKRQEEDTSDIVLDVAWRRYQQVQSSDYASTTESSEPSLHDLQTAFEPLLNHSDLSDSIVTHKYLTVSANTIPWQPTEIFIGEDQPVSVFATGRTWRSRLLDMYLPPQFALWYRIGVNGEVFNSTRNTRTFKCIPGHAGELYLAPQFPGQFASRSGGRVQSGLSAYEKTEGAFQVMIILWKPGMYIGEDVYQKLIRIYELSDKLGSPDPYNLIGTALSRLSSNYFEHHFPVGWSLLWFLGMSEVFTEEEEEMHLSTDQNKIVKPAQNPESIAALSPPLLSPEPQDGIATLTLRPTNSLSHIRSTTSPSPTKVIRCLPSHNVGILQKDLSSPLQFSSSTTVSWFWNIPSLPSRLREDTALTHDYLSVAFEFNNGRDLTYTWSWELPKGFGYWCPLPTWCDREYHIVLQTGTEKLGEWISETRDLWADYVRYINNGDDTKSVPSQLVRVWLIAGNRWQRHRGEMLVKGIVVRSGNSAETIVL